MIFYISFFIQYIAFYPDIATIQNAACICVIAFDQTWLLRPYAFKDNCLLYLVLSKFGLHMKFALYCTKIVLYVQSDNLISNITTLKQSSNSNGLLKIILGLFSA